MVRTQLYLDESLHRQLRRLADKQGRTVSDLVREAVARAYGSEVEARSVSLEGITGLWHDRDDLEDTAEYVNRIRSGARRRQRLE